ncbi:MraY family glycosyltransferase [Stomatohabitans albus]|uniref:MraY family glycosyltransferase n=1 Tax=Stomatohabitans albus TaxID=3110766 RepID=UPI00300DB10E
MVNDRVFDHLIVLGVAFLAAVVLTPIVVRTVTWFGLLKAPGGRNVHTKPTPEFGGIAMYVAVLIALAVATQLPAFRAIFGTTSEPEAMVLSSALIFWVGLLDDSRPIRAIVKLAGQVLAASVAVIFGVSVHYVYIPFGDGQIVSLSGELSTLVTVILIVAMVNAVNLVDGIDGLAAGIVCIASTAMLIWVLAPATTPYPSLQGAASLILAALIGTTLGFLVFNFHPASIFMGDTGAMMLGFLLGTASVSAIGNAITPSSSDFVVTAIPVLIPAAVLAIPFLDVLLAILRRTIQGRPIFSPDKNHLHHRILKLGNGQRGTVMILWGWAALIAFTVVGPVLAPFRPVLAFSAVGGVCLLIATWVPHWTRRHFNTDDHEETTSA